jgi:hypothetical protein
MKNLSKILVSIVSVLILLTNTGKSQSTDLVGRYRLTSLATSLSLDGNSKKIYPQGANGGRYQSWQFVGTNVVIDNNRAYTLTSYATYKSLDGNDTSIYPSNGNGGNYQKWLVIPTDVKDYYYLKSVATGKVLDGNADSVYPSDLNGGSYQKWKIEKVR